MSIASIVTRSRQLLAGQSGRQSGRRIWWSRSSGAPVGNAFFAEELFAAVRDRRRQPQSAAKPGECAAEPRPGPCPEDTQATLRIVAAASGPVEHELLAAVSDLPEPELLAALRTAVAHQVLVPDPDTETYAFRHALTQEALYGDLLPGERAQLHAAFARALAERRGSSPIPAMATRRLGLPTTGSGHISRRRRCLPRWKPGCSPRRRTVSPTRGVISRPFSSFGIRLPMPSSDWVWTVPRCCGMRPSRPISPVTRAGRSP